MLDLQQTADALAARLQKIDYERLPISDYNKQYIGNLKPVLPYYMQIYADCLIRGLDTTGVSPSSLTLVDYGGGSGFLSMLAKEIGVGSIIYLDLNPKSAETIQVLKELTQTGPDVILQGDSETLATWCEKNGVKPQLLVATDLIEHVYQLEPFFADLMRINSQMQLIFTTASTPFNPYVKWKLHRLMKGCESGSLESPNYYTQREKYIREQKPYFSPAEVARWSKQTRGMTLGDIRQALDRMVLPHPTDPYNTCDPANGNWTERILPIQTYRSLAPAGYMFQVKKGFYNDKRNNLFVGVFCKGLNFLIRYSGKAGLWLAPFLVLIYNRKQG